MTAWLLADSDNNCINLLEWSVDLINALIMLLLE